MDLANERDPAFARYRSAWRAYVVLQGKQPAENQVPYTVARTDPSNPTRQAAAIELSDARDEWLAERR